jgi:hypothetical protein
MLGAVLESQIIHVYSLPNSYSYLQHHLFPLLLRTLSECTAFSLAVRNTRVIPLLLKEISSEIETEVEVTLTRLIKLIGNACEP